MKTSYLKGKKCSKKNWSQAGTTVIVGDSASETTEKVSGNKAGEVGESDNGKFHHIFF